MRGRSTILQERRAEGVVSQEDATRSFYLPLVILMIPYAEGFAATRSGHRMRSSTEEVSRARTWTASASRMDLKDRENTSSLTQWDGQN